MKYLYPYECDRKKLSTPLELQNAIDGNRREGRRTSYGQYDGAMQGQLQHMVSRFYLSYCKKLEVTFIVFFLFPFK